MDSELTDKGMVEKEPRTEKISVLPKRSAQLFSVGALFRNLIIAACLGKAGCAAVPSRSPEIIPPQQPAASDTVKLEKTADEEVATPAEKIQQPEEKPAGGVREFTLTPEILAKYKSGTSPSILRSLEKEIGKSKNPDRIWRFLVKYNFSFHPNMVEETVMFTQAAAEALEWIFDSLKATYGLEFSKDLVNNALKTLNVAEGIESIFMSRALSVTSEKELFDLDSGHIHLGFLKTAQDFTGKVCGEKTRGFIEEFKRRINDKHQPSFRTLLAIIKIAVGKFPESEEEWARIKSASEKLENLVPKLYAKNSFSLALAAFNDPPVLINLEKMKNAGVAFNEDSSLSSEAIEFLARESLAEITDHPFYKYLRFQSDHFGAIDFNKLPKIHTSFVLYTVDEFKLSEDLARRVKQERKSKHLGGEIIVSLCYVARQQEVEKFQAAYGLELHPKNFAELMEAFGKFAARPRDIELAEDKTKKRRFDIYDPKVRGLMEPFIKGWKKDPLPGAKKDSLDDIKAFENAARLAIEMLQYFSAKELNTFVDLSKHGLVIDNIDLMVSRGELRTLLKNLADNRKILNDSVVLHGTYGIREGMDIGELKVLFNTDQETRGVLYALGKFLKPIFDELGVVVTGEDLQSFVFNQQTPAFLYTALKKKDAERPEPNREMIENIKYLHRVFGITSIPLDKWDDVVKIAVALGDNKQAVDKLGALFRRYQKPEEVFGFLGSASIYLANEKAEARINEWTDPKLLKAYDKVLKKFNVRGEASDLFGYKISDDLEQMADDRFATWVKRVRQAFQIDSKEFNQFGSVRTLWYAYKKENLRAFLVTPGAKRFFEESQKAGKEYKWYRFEDMMSDYENRDLLPYAQILQDNYGIKISDGGWSDIMGFQFDSGDKTDKGQMAYLRTLKKNGFLEDLKNPDTLRRFKELTKLLEMGEISQNEFLYFLQVNRNSAYFDRLVSGDFVRFAKEFRKRIKDFTLNMETVAVVFEAFEIGGVIDVFGKLESALGKIAVREFEDLEMLNLIAKTPKLLNALTVPDFSGKWKKVLEKDGSLSLGDVLLVLGINDASGNIDDLYEKTFTDFLLRVLQREYVAISERIAFLPYFRDPALKEKMLSEKFRAVLGKPGPLMGRYIHAGTIREVLFLMEHPDLLNKYIELRSGFLALLPFDEGDPGAGKIISNVLPSFLLLQTNPEVKKYREILRDTLPYASGVNDGVVLLRLTERYPSPETFRAACEDAASKLKGGASDIPKRSLALNDIMLLFGVEPVRYDRQNLEQEIAGAFKNDVHRTDSNFFSYRSYNDLSKWNALELNKILRLQRALSSDPDLRKHIGNGLRRDIEQEITTELGGLIEVDENGAIKFNYFPGETSFYNGAYDAPQNNLDNAPEALADFHQHATQSDSRKSASPSGAFGTEGGDIRVNASYRVDGVVITSLREGEFAVHMYNERRDVVFIGTFSY